MISNISQLVALVESTGVATALRFEPAYGSRWVTPEIEKRCIVAHSPAYMNRTTANVLCSISWGRYQCMGGLLYEMGYKGNLPNFSTDTTLQNAWFEKTLEYKGIKFTLEEIVTDEIKRRRFAKRYNGDEFGYAAKLLDFYNKNKGA